LTRRGGLIAAIGWLITATTEYDADQKEESIEKRCGTMRHSKETEIYRKQVKLTRQA
jgi:hypothetical protein